MEEEAYLPKATMIQFIKDNLNKTTKCSNESIELLLEISSEFIKNLAQETYKICIDENKKQLSPEQALQVLRKSDLKLDVEQITEELKLYQQEDHKSKSKMKNKFMNLNQEEMEAQQEKLFQRSRQFGVEENQDQSQQKVVQNIGNEDIKNADEIFGKINNQIDNEDFEVY